MAPSISEIATKHLLHEATLRGFSLVELGVQISRSTRKYCEVFRNIVEVEQEKGEKVKPSETF